MKLRVECPQCGPIFCSVFAHRWSHTAREEYRAFILKMHREIEHKAERLDAASSLKETK